MDEQQRIRQMNHEQILKIKDQLEKMSRAFKSITKSGIDREILICYLLNHTNMGRRDITEVLDRQNEFYMKLAKLAEDKK